MEENSDLNSVTPEPRENIPKGLGLQTRLPGNERMEKSQSSGMSCQANISPWKGLQDQPRCTTTLRHGRHVVSAALKANCLGNG